MSDRREQASRPLGVMDSGVGGLSVVRVLRRRFPAENVIYAADTGRLPYGERPPAQVRTFTSQVLRFLERQGVKAAVIGCNTASVAVWPGIQAEFPFPVVGMIEAGARAAARATRSGRVGVIGTHGTVASGAYPRALFSLGVTEVWQQGCPALPLLVEEGVLSGDGVRDGVARCVEPLLQRGIDTLLLACTHFAFLDPVIREVAGPDVLLVDPAEEVVRELGETLAALGWLCGDGDGHVTVPGWLRLFTSGSVPRFREIAGVLLGERVEAAAGDWVDESGVGVPRRGGTGGEA